MKAFALFVLLLSCHLTASTQTYQVSFEEEPALSVLRQLIKTYDLKVSYSASFLRPYKISKEVIADNPEELLEALLDGLPFTVKTNNNLLLIVPSKQTRHTFARVVDTETDAPLAFALVQGASKSFVTSEEGSFRLEPRQDSVELIVSYLGYKEKKVFVSPYAESIVIALEQNPTILQEVVLNGYAQQGLFATPSSYSLNPRKFNSLPVLGETDVFKTLQLLPGISATDESALGIRVRGGTHSQNLVTMDGFTVYNQDHFFGLFSSFNPNFIDRVNIYKGGFGAEYGGRVSSVVEVQTKSGTGDQLNASAGINFLSTNAFIEVPIGQQLTFLSGFRRSFSGILQSDFYQDFLSASRQDFIFLIEDLQGAQLPLTPTVGFYDFNAKLSYRPNSKTSLDISFYQNEDNYDGSLISLTEDPLIEFRLLDKTKWSNLGIGLVLNHFVNPNWNIHASLGGSHYQNSETLDRTDILLEEVEFEGEILPENTLIASRFFNAESSLDDVSFKVLNTFFINPSNELQAGLEFNALSTDFESFNSFSDFSGDELLNDVDSIIQRGDVLSFFAGDALTLGNFSANIGFRGSYYDGTEQWYLEPRFQSTYRVKKQFKLKFAYTVHHQYLTQVALASENIDQEYWVLADRSNVPVAKSKHLIIGSDFQKGRFLFEIEGYRKFTDHIYQTGFFPFITSEDPEISASDFVGSNTTYGVDFFIKYRANRFNSWISYTLADSENAFRLLNEGQPFPSDIDQRHEVNWVNTLKLGKWEMASTFIYGSGRPFNTVALIEEQFRDFIERNNQIETERLPSYYRMDISAKYTFSINKLRGDIGTSIFNLLNFQNIRSRRRVLLPINEESASVINFDNQLLGRTPNFFLNLHF